MTSTALSAETWELIGTLFDQLAALPPDERDLDTLDQPRSVRTLLDQMLAAHDTADPQLLDRTVRAVAGTLLQDQAVPAPVDYSGRGFGPWRALEEIGRGGMAVVLRGERADGRFEKEVAIKLLPHTGAGVERERLLEEIRILARLEHPNIARLIDGGIGDDGTPYLVMEYVHGVPINEYCNRHKLNTRARVQLLMQVVDAALFAHRHLVVHCDIKPGNILVADEGQAKLVDFGIAGLMSGGAGAETMPRGLFCSPAYCAPEQMRGAPPDTAQDIFSLGAVLYELLCGQRIRDNKAATRMLFGAEADTPAVSPPSRYNSGVTRDLDAVCLKTLAEQPGERYAGANALLADLKRWLAGEPVSARAGGASYRLGKWLRRHWLPAAAAGTAALALLGGTAVALWQAREARLQTAAALAGNQRADMVRDFLVELFEVSDPDISAGQVPDTRQLLNAGTRMADQAFVENPPLRAELLYTLARINRKLGDTDTAHTLLTQAENTIGDEHPDLQWRLGLEQVSTYIMQTEYEQAKHLLDRLDTRLEDELNDEARSRIDIARVQVLSRTGDTMPRAVTLAREILDRPLVETGGIPLAILAHSTALGVFAIDGELEAASEVGQAAVRLMATGHASPSRRIAIYNNLASVERRLGNSDAGIELRRQALALAREVFAPPHYQQAYLAGNLGGDLVMAGHLGEAREELEYAATMFGRLFSTPNQRTAGVDNNLGILLTSLELPEEALPYLERSLEVHRRELGTEHPHVLTARANRAAALSLLGRFEAAEAELLDVLATRQRLFGETHQYVLVSQEGLAAHYLRTGAGEKALARAESALAGWQQQAPEGHPRIITLTGYRAQALALLGRLEQAQAAFEQARTRAAEAESGVNRGYLTVMDFYSAFLVDHRPQQATRIIPELLADPLLQGAEERPEWRSLSDRGQMLRRQSNE